jgi:hypothetical protein
MHKKELTYHIIHGANFAAGDFGKAVAMLP